MNDIRRIQYYTTSFSDSWIAIVPEGLHNVEEAERHDLDRQASNALADMVNLGVLDGQLKVEVWVDGYTVRLAEGQQA